MNLVVTDGYPLNSGDLNWDALHAFGNVTVYNRTPENEIAARCRDAQIVVTNKTPFSRHTLAQLPLLKCIAVTATGYNVIDTKAAAGRGILVCNVPGYGTASVAQQVFALLLELTNAVGRHSVAVKEGAWSKAPDWCFALQPIVELSSKTMGLVGYGNIGQQVAKIASAFGMQVIYFNPSSKAATVGFQKPLQEVFAKSDVVSLHCPLTPENKGFVNKDLLQTMKPSAYLINTARGPLINEADLADALNKNVLAGAALDVLSVEPPAENQLALMGAKNCLITPHNAWMSREARQRILTATEKNIAAFLQGKPVNKVN